MNFEKSESINELATALSVAQGVLHGAVKDSVNPAFGAPRKYADLSSCWDACRKPLSDNGLAVIQAVSATGPAVTITTILTHKSGQFISGSLTMTSEKSSPQGIGGAITYGRRYALCAMVGIAPEDDDGNEASGVDAPKRGSKEKQQEVASQKLAQLSSTIIEPGPQTNGPQAVSRPVSKDGVFLEQCQVFKRELTEPLYRYVLRRAGYAKSNEAVTPEQKATLLKKLAAAQKVATVASHGEFMPSLMSAEVFALLPDTSVAAIMKEFRAKLTAVCGGQEIARDEYEAARKECENGTQFDFCMALMRKHEHYSKQGVA